MPIAADGVSASTFRTVVTLAIVVTALYVASGILLPVALAVMLTFVLTPLVRRLEQWHVPRIPAVVLTALFVAAVIGAALISAGGQLVSFSARLPAYRENMKEKIDTFRSATEPVLERIWASSALVENLAQGETGPANPPTAVPDSAELGQATPATRRDHDQDLGTGDEPLAVSIVDKPFDPLSLVNSWLGPVLSPFGSAVVVVVFTIFMLIEREDLRARVVVLLGIDRVPGTTQLLDTAARRVSRYLQMQLLINSLYGIAICVVSLAGGLPNPVLWGCLAMVFRFIPYLGPSLGSGIPVVLAMVLTEGWTTMLWLLSGVVLLELVINNVLEPLLYGSSAGVSPFGILISAFFWTWLWGPPGLILATPLTVFITQLGRHVPALSFVTTLLSDGEVLTPSDQLYQRLLANDLQEVRLQLAGAQRENSPQVMAEMLFEPLVKATQDACRGAIAPEQLAQCVKAIDQMTEEAEALETFTLPPNERPPLPKLLVAPTSGSTDKVAARLTALYLRHEGWDAAASHGSSMTHDAAVAAMAASTDAVLVCALGGTASKRATFFVRKIRSLGWTNPLVALVVSGQSSPSDRSQVDADEVAESLSELKVRLNAARTIALTHLQRMSAETDVTSHQVDIKAPDTIVSAAR